MKVAINGTGLYHPPDYVSNEELVESFNTYVKNHPNVAQEPSSCEFIEKASGVLGRYFMDKKSILDPHIMALRLPERSNEMPSYQCEMGLKAAMQALEEAQVSPHEVDAVIVGCSNLGRPYPAISVEILAALGGKGFAYDMNVACSSATFALAMAYDTISMGRAKNVLVINPEICSGHLNFRDRHSHFIFGDAATAVLCRPLESCYHGKKFIMLHSKLQVEYSNHIRNNFGFLSKAAPEHSDDSDKLFTQNGRKVYKEVVGLVTEHLREHFLAAGIHPSEVRRFWAHQANSNMNRLIAEKVFGRELSVHEMPMTLEEFANTSSAGVLISFHRTKDDLQNGDIGLLCSFGAGYSVGSILLERG